MRLPCARSNSFLDHKSSSSSTTTWITGRSTRRSLSLRVCVHPQLHFIRQQLLQYTALLPRAPRIETEATLRDNCNCKLFVLFLSVYCLLLTVRVFCLPGKPWPDNNVIFQFNLKDSTQSSQDAIPHHGFYVIKLHDLNERTFSCCFLRLERDTGAGVFLDPLQL